MQANQKNKTITIRKNLPYLISFLRCSLHPLPAGRGGFPWRRVKVKSYRISLLPRGAHFSTVPRQSFQSSDGFCQESSARCSLPWLSRLEYPPYSERQQPSTKAGLL